MIVLFGIISAISLIVGVIIYNINEKKINIKGGYSETLYNGSSATMIIGGAILVVCIIASLCVGGKISSLSYIDDKVALYQTENDRIESEINTIIENYKDYEQGTFERFKGKDATTLVTLFPELKSDKLVKKQIDIYNDNKKKIVQLKEEKINVKPFKWWLYFGS